MISNIKLIKYYKEPEYKYNIVSVSVFRLENPYKDFDKYYNGLKRLVSLFLKNNVYEKYILRIYFDDSIIKATHKNKLINEEINNKWKPLFEELKTNKKVQLVKYECSKLYDGLYHYGLFGTLMRFIPLFDYEDNKNINEVFINDIDIGSNTYKNIKFIQDLIKKYNSTHFFYTYVCYLYQNRFVSLDQELNDKEKLNFDYRTLAGYIYSKKKISKDIFNKFIKCLIDIKLEVRDINIECDILNKFKNYSSRSLNKSKTIRDVLKFGIDEFFLNYILIKHLINKNEQIDFLVKPPTTPFDSNDFIKHILNNQELGIKIKKQILGSLYNPLLSLKDNYLTFEKKFINIARNKSLKIDKDKIKDFLLISKNINKVAHHLYNTNTYQEYNLKERNIKCFMKFKNYANHFIRFKNNQLKLL